MIVVTTVVVVWVDRERLERKLEEAVGTLNDESIEEDRRFATQTKHRPI